MGQLFKNAGFVFKKTTQLTDGSIGLMYGSSELMNQKINNY